MKKNRCIGSETKREIMKGTWVESVSAGRIKEGIWGYLLPLVATACVAGCALPGDFTDASADDPSLATPASTAEGNEPETGVLHVKTRSGIVPLEYTVRNGRAIYQDDIVLGKIEAVRREEAQRSLAIRDLGARWPDGNITFSIDPSVTAPGIPVALFNNLMAAIASYQALTPITFTQFPSGGQLGALEIVLSGDPGVSYSSGIGWPGLLGSANLELWPGNVAFPNAQLASAGTIIHELGHALGLYHEQKRSDRASTVLFSPACVQPSRLSQFAIESMTTSEFLAPYDVTSIMHYNSASFCIPAVAPAVPVGGTNCACLPLVLQGTSNTSTAGILPTQGVALSQEDINTLWQMYEPRLGTNEANDGMGSAIAVGDFDNDGYSDMAVGAPGDAFLPGSLLTAGAVYVFKGTSGGPVAWRVLTQDSSLLSTSAVGEKFGSALTVGDFNNDGFADLVVGAPGDVIPGVAGAAGSVFVFSGSQAGPTPLVRIDQTGLDVNEDGDEFGTALTVNDFDNDGFPDLAVGAPGETDALGINAGAVYVFKGAGTTFSAWQSLSQTGFLTQSNSWGDRFGQALASGDLLNDRKPELIVGVPETTVPDSSGVVDVFTLSTSVSPPVFTAAQALRQRKLDLPKAGDEFGASLLVADLDGELVDGRPYLELAVGAPGKDAPVDSGRVVLFKKAATETLLLSHMLGFNGTPLAGDRFGQALGSIDFNMDGKSDLLVGAPGRDIVGTDNGAVVLYQGTSFPLTQTQLYLNTNSTSDRFGSALASGAIDKIADLPDLVVGAPGAASGAGAFNFFTGALTAPFLPAGGGYFDQETQSPQ